MKNTMTALLEGVASLEIAHPASGAAARLTVSAGAVSLLPTRDRSMQETLESTDRLLYEAKEAGRNRCVLLDLATDRKTVITITR